MKTQAFFQDIRQHLLDEISNATQQIIIAVAWFTDKKIFSSLLSKAEKGLDVQIMIADDSINNSFGPNYHEIETYGGTVIKVSTPNPEAVMHNKFCIIDSKTVITGSYNWSKRASTNHENITVTWDEPLLAQQFLKEFDSLKKRYYQQGFINGKIPFDYVKVSQRLLMIQSLINLNEFQELEIQLEKLQQFELIAEVEDIISLIRRSHYSNALVALEQLKEKYNSIVSVDVDKIASLRLQLIYLEIELSSLQGQRDSLERTISDFRYQVRSILGDIILQFLNLKIEWNKIREKLGKASKYEDLKEEFEEFEKEVKEAKEKHKQDLTKEEEKEIKQLYKKGVQMCHPDKVQEEFKNKAKDIFIRLKQAFDDNNLSEVRRIVEALENGIWELGPELSQIREVDKLEKLVQELKLKVEELKFRIEELNANEDYQALLKAGGIKEYIRDQEISLKKDIINYQEKIMKYKDGKQTTKN